MAAYEAGRAAAPEPHHVDLAEADGLTLAVPLTTLTPLPAFPTSSVDGYAARGAGPWRVAGRVLAGTVPDGLEAGTAVEIATGAMVPPGTERIIRVEDSRAPAEGLIDGDARPTPDWREPGDEAAKGEELLPAGVPVTPGVIGLAAACGYDTLQVYPAPTVALAIFGDELATSGPPGHGLVRDALGPQLPAWLRRLGGADAMTQQGPVEDTLEAHVAAIKRALSQANVVCTTGGTMHGPVDHVHPALASLGARYVVNTVAVRPGFPMLLAEIPPDESLDGRPKFIAGLPGNPQSAIVALMTLVAPLLAGLTGLVPPPLVHATLGAEIPGRGDYTHLALIRVRRDGLAHPLAHSGSAMLRGVARADGFAVIDPGTSGEAGSLAECVPLPIYPGGRP